MREKIIEILGEICPGVDVANHTALVDDDILNSIGIIRLVEAVESEFNIEINYTDIEPENLNDVQAIQELIEKKCDSV